MGIYQLVVYLMYGCGLRMSEALNIRIKDIDFGFDSGIDLISIQELFGHKSVETTMVYTHIVAEINKSRVVSPLDML